ncbi:hypothetical protein ACET3X_007782 [Alternaria dauci]|uniref:BTB domain-containing protein n=1 Tax=Alternaria dauci TaxID=48095 RepID=A0ABR3UFK3_9PLEO
MARRPRDAHMARLKALLSIVDYSDLIITCGPDTYNVHKAVVCPQSLFFKKAERFPVGKEAEEGTIDLPRDNPQAVRLLVQFFYECEYDPELPKLSRFDKAGRPIITGIKDDQYHYSFPHSCDGTQLLIHAMMYEVADKYDITELRQLAQEKFSLSCDAFWETEPFAKAVEHALTTTPESDTGLRKVLAETIVSHISLLDKPAVATLLDTYPGFAHSVLRRLAEEAGWLKPIVKAAS